MARTVGMLTTLKVERAKRGEEPAGLYPDGNGLYLQITKARRKGESEAEHAARPPSAASWLLRYQLAGRAREMGLGPIALYGLAKARALALDAKRLAHQGIDPIDNRREDRARLRLEAAKAVTFKAATEAYITAHGAGWADKTKAGWESTLATYAEPIIGALPVQAIDTALILKVLEPIWTKKPEIAGRVRQRMEALLDWAKARGYRDGENPARWDGHLDKLLVARAKVRKVQHHAALPYPEIGDFMRALRAHQGAAADALELTILCAARTGEIIGARPQEVDLAEKIWTVPPERMKAGKEHRVPLSDAAIAVIKRRLEAGGDYLFAGGKKGKPISNMAMLKLLERMARDDLTVHGFRSTFRDWAAERTNFPREVAEAALAHVVEDKVEAAYRRGDLFQKRRQLMDAWARHCAAPKAAAVATVRALRG